SGTPGRTRPRRARPASPVARARIRRDGAYLESECGDAHAPHRTHDAPGAPGYEEARPGRHPYDVAIGQGEVRRPACGDGVEVDGEEPLFARTDRALHDDPMRVGGEEVPTGGGYGARTGEPARHRIGAGPDDPPVHLEVAGGRDGDDIARPDLGIEEARAPAGGI